jgi:small subunit ribosomal protein S6
MREYEVTVVLQPQLDDDARNALIQRIEGWLTAPGADAPKPVINHWGSRQMAYSIKKNTEGYYVFCEAMLDPAAVHAIERNMTYVEDILRYLFVRKDS